ncbi:MAG TPA: SRPBCC family protein [Sphingomonas sp.]|jgi:phenylpropionate dioxygenase-like ring-hydroxylating dioxygenase large terminal subunit|uniref:aromatic ring-hydroxylating oxygenase subunit alpha n=1 Tax=Sphingomonas sp. TaxID=28214 RepID=UPI002ED890C2
MDHHDIGHVAETLLDYVEQNRTFQSDRITTVPAASYTDPEQWAREVDVVFKRVPLMLALSCELPGPGSYKAMDAMGLPVLISRDKQGVARAFLNVCSHRGAPLASDGHGTCARFTCKYHSWSYALDGRLLAIADREKFGDLDKTTLGLKALPCVERGGMIFAVLTPGEPVDFDGFFAGMLDDFDAWGLKDWAFLGSREIEGANWKIAFDGYLEGYHFASLHPTTIHPRTPSNVTHYESFGAHMRIGFPQVGIAQLRDVPRDQWSGQENRGFDFVRILFPNISAFLAPEIAQIAQLFPGPTPDRNRTVLLYARRDPPRDAEDQAALDAMITFLRDVTYTEDYLIGLEIQKGLRSGALDRIVLGRNERGNQFFHETLDWYLGGRQGPQPVI